MLSVLWIGGALIIAAERIQVAMSLAHPIKGGRQMQPSL